MNAHSSVHGAAKPAFATILGAILLLAGSSLRAAEELQPLFNGRNLEGWVQRGGKATYAVEDGVIVGTTILKTPNSFLCTQREYGDFILELEVRADEGLNSGIQIRSQCFDEPTPFFWEGKTNTISAGRVHGYQVEVDHRPERRWSGGIYDEGRRGWLFPLGTNSPAGQAYKFGEWNHFRIVCNGPSIKTWVNGVSAADLWDAQTLKGFIGLQVHSAKQAGLQVRFRNIRLQDLGRHVWKPLWDGRTWNGWKPIGKGEWQIVDGAIRGTNVKDEKDFGHLVTDRTFGDFTVRVTYRAVRGNSGLYFRVAQSGHSGVSGFQAEIDAEKDAGGLYETNGRGWVRQPAPEAVRKYFRPQEWNTMTVMAHGRRVAVDVNGRRSAELSDDPGRPEGYLALQAHGSQDVEVWFKDIELLVKEN